MEKRDISAPGALTTDRDNLLQEDKDLMTTPNERSKS